MAAGRHLFALALVAAAGGPPPARPGAAERDAQVAAGRIVYREGRSPSGGEITALLGGDATPLPGAALPCASCHGPDGQGRPEGAVRPSAITWSELTRPGGHAHARGRHGPYDARTLGRAITEGLDPDGGRLDAAMPRYSLAARDLAALVAYLQVLETERDPGLSDAEVRIGTVLPLAGRLAATGAALQAALEAAVGEANAGGGLNGRRVALVVEGYDADRDDGRAAARRLLEGPPVFALVSGFTPGAEAEVAALAEAHGVPAVGPFTPFAGGGEQVFHVLGGLSEQARVLVTWGAARPELARPRAAVLRLPGRPFEAAAEAAVEAAAARGWPAPEVVPVGVEGPSAVEVAGLAARGVAAVLLLGDDVALAALLGQAAAAGFTPFLLAPGTLAALAAAGAPAPFDGRILLAYPSRPEDVGAAGRARLARLPGAGPGARPQPGQVAALAAFDVLAEGLRRAGRQLSRERLVAALEGLSGHETGLTPPVTFGPRRRVGALGGYVLVAEGGRLRPVSGWVRLD